MKLKPCPWCGIVPELVIVTVSQNYDSIGNRWDAVRNLSHEKIECNNVRCLVRPRLHRTNAFDAVSVWNNHSLTSVEPDKSVGSESKLDGLAG